MSLVFKGSVMAVALMLTVTGAQTAPLKTTPVNTGDSARTIQSSPSALYICENDAASRRAFKREYGAVVYLTAEQALNRTAPKAPKPAAYCITPSEFSRLQGMTSRLTYVAGVQP